MVVVAIVSAILLGLLWFDSYSTTRRLIFVPGGDVGLGFKSANGSLQWIEYAPWDQKNQDSPWWSVPYRYLILVCAVFAVSLWVAGEWLGRNPRHPRREAANR